MPPPIPFFPQFGPHLPPGWGSQPHGNRQPPPGSMPQGWPHRPPQAGFMPPGWPHGPQPAGFIPFDPALGLPQHEDMPPWLQPQTDGFVNLEKSLANPFLQSQIPKPNDEVIPLIRPSGSDEVTPPAIHGQAFLQFGPHLPPGWGSPTHGSRPPPSGSMPPGWPHGPPPTGFIRSGWPHGPLPAGFMPLGEAHGLPPPHYMPPWLQPQQDDFANPEKPLAGPFLLSPIPKPNDEVNPPIQPSGSDEVTPPTRPGGSDGIKPPNIPGGSNDVKPTTESCGCDSGSDFDEPSSIYQRGDLDESNISSGTNAGTNSNANPGPDSSP